jgi:hypothetical protein
VSDQAPPETAGEPHPEAAFSAQMQPDQAAVDDAGDLTGFHFRRLMRKRLTWILSGILIVAAAGIGGAVGGPVFAVIAAVVVALLCLLGVWLMASSASEQAFFTLYARQRGLAREENGELMPATPLLRKGDERKAEEIMRGPLGDGVEGTLALYTYTDVYNDKNGRHESDYHFTVGIAELPGCERFVSKLYCNRKSGFRFTEKLEDAFRSNERVELESEALADEYEIFVGKGQDQNWIRQLFSPSFIVWLSDSAPDKFAFELEGGTLCCNVKGHKKDAAHLDAMRSAATAVAQRINEEVAE